MKLTKTSVEKLEATGKRYSQFDEELRGLRRTGGGDTVIGCVLYPDSKHVQHARNRVKCLPDKKKPKTNTQAD